MLSLAQMPFPHKYVNYAPEVCRCPRCGMAVVCHESRERYFWEPGLVYSMILVATVGCYVCREHPPGEQWFNALPPDLQGRAQYACSTMEKVVAFVCQFKMPLILAAKAARVVFHLPMLNDTTVLDWMRDMSLEVDITTFQDRAAEAFSGQLDVDEVYDGGYGQLKATDPIRGVELEYELIDGPIQEEHVLAFFRRLKDRGFEPLLVTTDGSPLYPKAIALIWPDAQHQRCVFHFIKQCNEDLMKACWVAYACRRRSSPPSGRHAYIRLAMAGRAAVQGHEDPRSPRPASQPQEVRRRSTIWASVLSLLASQALYRLIRSLLDPDRALPLLRWASKFAEIAGDLLTLVITPSPEAERKKRMYLLYNAPDPNRNREDRALDPILGIMQYTHAILGPTVSGS